MGAGHALAIVGTAVGLLALSPRNLHGEWIPRWARVECFDGTVCAGQSLLDPVVVVVCLTTTLVLVVVMIGATSSFVFRDGNYRSTCGALLLACAMILTLNFAMASLSYAIETFFRMIAGDLQSINPGENFKRTGMEVGAFRSVRGFVSTSKWLLSERFRSGGSLSVHDDLDAPVVRDRCGAFTLRQEISTFGRMDSCDSADRRPDYVRDFIAILLLQGLGAVYWLDRDQVSADR